MQAPKFNSLALWIAGTAIMALSASGFAALMASMPARSSASRDLSSRAHSSVEFAKAAAATKDETLPSARRIARLKAKCGECGLIQSIVETARRPLIDGLTPDSSIGRVITVRLEDGSTRVISDANPAKWRIGERVKIIDGLAGPGA